ncbi:hypothetical protein PDIG_75200 [Penicillium digitatum PHI26]|uniref:Uncharacterized protein n=2 Tax=Penicillium digitatum TaxID=36651 RepID=K9G168_PEND2|nr:hypothetical protein PDIP_45670 [Penicillium digitatum Pd1]EKV07006.1 hypothetical protein PDIG_75200 [Penicillium digitatum PHI26]EKV13971.1 hypothetical protein PDIP_45670 [Penicillium digitatum Pd1]
MSAGTSAGASEDQRASLTSRVLPIMTLSEGPSPLTNPLTPIPLYICSLTSRSAISSPGASHSHRWGRRTRPNLCTGSSGTWSFLAVDYGSLQNLGDAERTNPITSFKIPL